MEIYCIDINSDLCRPLSCIENLWYWFQTFTVQMKFISKWVTPLSSLTAKIFIRLNTFSYILNGNICGIFLLKWILYFVQSMWKESRTEYVLAVILLLLETAFLGVIIPHKQPSYGRTVKYSSQYFVYPKTCISILSDR